MADDSSLAFGVIASLGSAGFIGAVVNGVINRRKLGAEATDLITRAASTIVDRLEAENIRLAGRVLALEQQAAGHDANLRKVRHDLRNELQMHTQWDFEAVAALSAAGVDFALPPPLLPQSGPAGPEWPRPGRLS